MKKVICSVYDCKAEAWLTPMFLQARGQAVRIFSDAVNGDGDLAKHPEDYTLFCIGEFDELKGSIEAYDAPVVLEKGMNIVWRDEQ